MRTFIPKEALKEAYITTIDIGVREEGDFSKYTKTMNQSFDNLINLDNSLEFQKLLDYANALANDIRLKILHFIFANGKSCFCELENLFGIKKSTLNYHVKMLLKAGLLKSSKIGKLVILELGAKFHELIPESFMTTFNEQLENR